MERCAASSHKENEKYMQRFHEAYKRLQDLSIKDMSKQGFERKPKKIASKEPLFELRKKPSLSSSNESSFCWTTGIDTTRSTKLDLSQRPLLCSAVHHEKQEAVVGSSDHALYTVNVGKRRLHRTLYTQTSGHSEWVTCVAYIHDGRIVSGGMDQKLCLWSRDSTHCTDLIGHEGSISGVSSVQNIIVSSSYDKSLKLWSNKNGKVRSTLHGHKAPILQLSVSSEYHIASGDRGGSVFIWDLEHECLSWRLKKIHKGHITTLKWLDASQGQIPGPTKHRYFLSGGQDGTLRMWDVHNHSNLFKEKLHGGLNSSAAINEILVHPSDSNLLITCGADQTLKVTDMRKGFAQAVWDVSLSDFPYSAGFYGDLVICGCGDGNVSVFDVRSLDVKSTLHIGANAIRFLHTFTQKMVCGGDDGQFHIYDIY